MKPPIDASDLQPDLATVETRISLEPICASEALARRGSRRPQYKLDNEALVEAMDALARTRAPADMDAALTTLAECALRLCRAHSAGIVVCDESNEMSCQRAVAGSWPSVEAERTITDWERGLCRLALDRNVPLLVSRPGWRWGSLDGTRPIVEALLVPFRCNDGPAGMLWVAAHDEAVRFDGEDERSLQALSRAAAFASALLAERVRSEREARVLHSLSAALIEGQDIESMFEKLIDAAMATLRSQFASLQMYYPERGSGGELKLLAYRGFNAQVATHWQWVGTAAQCSCGAALREGRRIVVPDVDAAGFSRETADYLAYKQAGIRAVQSTPLIARGGKLVGMISTHWDHVHSPSERELGWLDIVARQAAEAIERKRVEDELRASERKERSRALMLQSVLDTSPTPIWIALDWTCEAVISNRAAGALLAPAGGVFSWAPGAAQAGGLRFLRDGQEICIEMLPLPRCARTGTPVVNEELEIVGEDGSSTWLLMQASALHDGNDLRGAVAVAVDITTRKQAELELRAADQRKDHFVATLAHELRNPLAAIRNAVQVVMATSPGDAELKWCHDLMDRQVRQVVRLLDDLLDVSRVSHGKLELRKERVALDTVIQSAVETCRPLITLGSHELKLSLTKAPIHVDADPVRLSQVFSNLLSNAAKYTPNGGHIELSVRRHDALVNVSVKDDGIGIPADMLTTIFEPFSQATSALHRSQGGVGIGLSLVRGLVALHGGAVEGRSDGPLLGAEFVVTLPVACAVARAAPPRDIGREEPRKAKRRVLVVDDMADSAESLCLLLRTMGHDARIAYAGEEAVKMVSTLRPEAVFLDIGMPGMDGYETCRRIRAEPDGARIAMFALTGWGQFKDRARSKAAGFDEHLVKPVDLGKLHELLASLPTMRTRSDAS